MGYVVFSLKDRNLLISEAKKDQIVIVIDLFTTHWCPPCKATKAFLGIIDLSQKTEINSLVNSKFHTMCSQISTNIKEKHSIKVQFILFICDCDLEDNTEFCAINNISSIPRFIISAYYSNLSKKSDGNINAITSNTALETLISNINNITEWILNNKC